MDNIFFVYVGASILFTVGFGGIMLCDNFLKKIYALGFMQGGAILFYIAIAFRENATLPIFKYELDHQNFPRMANPLPHVLMLTAIVVGIALIALAISILNNVARKYETLSEYKVKEHILTADKKIEEKLIDD